MKSKQRFKQLTPRLELATDSELFTELMKRAYAKQPCVCYFIDRNTVYDKWSIHTANQVVITIGEVIK